MASDFSSRIGRCGFPTGRFRIPIPTGLPQVPRSSITWSLYARRIRAAVRCGVTVTALRKDGFREGYIAETSAGSIKAAHVVIASGPYQKPFVPDLSVDRHDLLQIHASSYKAPSQIRTRSGVDSGIRSVRRPNCRRTCSRRPTGLPVSRAAQTDAAPLSRARFDLVACQHGARSNACRRAWTRLNPAAHHRSLWRPHSRFP